MRVLVSGLVGSRAARCAGGRRRRAVGGRHVPLRRRRGRASRYAGSTSPTGPRCARWSPRCARTPWSNTPYRYDDWAVTADGAAHVAVAAAEVGARLVHVSSDALHAGRPEPYADDDAADAGARVRRGEGGGRDRRARDRPGRGRWCAPR